MVEEGFFLFFAEWQNESGQDLKGIWKVVHTDPQEKGEGKRKAKGPKPKSPGANSRCSSVINQLCDPE